MPPPSFFPDPVFGWGFYGLLLGFLAVASYTDLRWVKIPKWLTVTMLGVGVVVSMARGGWLGSVLAGTEGARVWVLPASAGLGVLDGFLFAGAGFLASFAFFLVLFIFGMAAGGDVKLFAALGAWVGPFFFFLLFIGTGAFIVLGMMAGMARKIARGGASKTFSDVVKATSKTKGKGKGKASATPKVREGQMTYSLAVALSAALLIPFLFAKDLRLVPPKMTNADQTAARSPQ